MHIFILGGNVDFYRSIVSAVLLTTQILLLRGDAICMIAGRFDQRSLLVSIKLQTCNNTITSMLK